jgi:hypothetical protein
MNYNLVEMKSYDGDYHDALVAYSDGLDNDTLREGAILNRIDQEYFIIKYKERNLQKIIQRWFREVIRT